MSVLIQLGYAIREIRSDLGGELEMDEWWSIGDGEVSAALAYFRMSSYFLQPILPSKFQSGGERRRGELGGRF